jgi:hypothetical protein
VTAPPGRRLEELARPATTPYDCTSTRASGTFQRARPGEPEHDPESLPRRDPPRLPCRRPTGAAASRGRTGHPGPAGLPGPDRLQELLLVFDPLATIGGTAGVKAAYLREGFEEIRPLAALLGEDFEVLRDLRLVKYSQVISPGPLPGAFRRGDADGNGSVNITDPIRILRWLFIGETPPSCFDAADTDDSGSIDITDAVRILVYLFTAPELAPSPPGPSSCGFDETPDDLPECEGGC